MSWLRKGLTKNYLKERNKVMRALKKTDSPFLDGQRIYYDYLRPHTALDGKTPAQAAGIDLQLEGNKWEAIIKRASKANH